MPHRTRKTVSLYYLGQDWQADVALDFGLPNSPPGPAELVDVRLARFDREALLAAMMEHEEFEQTVLDRVNG